MENKTTESFKQILTDQLNELSVQADQTISELMEQNSREIEEIDQASMNSHQALKLKIRTRESRLIKKIRQALERIENNTYGICEFCGKEIQLKRLEARPVTTKCIQCKEEEEKRELLIK